eukprot:749620-Hanusia_phi.AAC.2
MVQCDASRVCCTDLSHGRRATSTGLLLLHSHRPSLSSPLFLSPLLFSSLPSASLLPPPSFLLP